MLNLEIISKKIIEKRKLIGMSQNELADALFVTRQAVSKWEMGKCLPSIDVLVEMTELFDVTIDYMLDGSDLRDNDYATMFMQFPRESVIYRFINSDHLNTDIKNIFYLLTTKERKQMIDQFLNGYLKLDAQMLWPCLSMAERKYLLGNMVSKDINQDLECLYAMMTTEERSMMNIDKTYFITKITKKGEK